MKKILCVLCIVLLLFVVGCKTGMSSEQLKAELADLSDEELDMLIEDVRKGDGSIAGQATYIEKDPVFVESGVSTEELLIASQDLKIERLEQEVEMLEDQLVPEDDLVPWDGCKDGMCPEGSESSTGTSGTEKSIIIDN